MPRRVRRGRARAWLARLRRLPPAAWAAVAAILLVAGDVTWQLARKPTEILGLLSAPAAKTPEETWSEYRPLFEAHATEVIRPELLGALAQVESAGDPLARTYWRWQWTWNPLDVYGPASSAVGLLQITDGTFAEARRLCIHGHEVAHQGPWLDPHGCWFNGLYFRTVPSHAIEMTSAYLHEAVGSILAEGRLAHATLDQRQRLAAVVHLCGREHGAAYARRGFWVMPGERCGDHDLALYLLRVERLRKSFARLG